MRLVVVEDLRAAISACVDHSHDQVSFQSLAHLPHLLGARSQEVLCRYFFLQFLHSYIIISLPTLPGGVSTDNSICECKSTNGLSYELGNRALVASVG